MTSDDMKIDAFRKAIEITATEAVKNKTNEMYPHKKP
jgi:hypothetical protein